MRRKVRIGDTVMLDGEQGVLVLKIGRLPGKQVELSISHPAQVPVCRLEAKATFADKRSLVTQVREQGVPCEVARAQLLKKLAEEPWRAIWPGQRKRVKQERDFRNQCEDRTAESGERANPSEAEVTDVIPREIGMGVVIDGEIRLVIADVNCAMVSIDEEIDDFSK
jgi:hypothetical protein